MTGEKHEGKEDEEKEEGRDIEVKKQENRRKMKVNKVR